MKYFTSILTILVLLLISSCSSDPNVARGQAGGAAIGGLAGGLITDSWGGAAAGAAIGGLVGGEMKRR